tara:strand:- start:464 stop:973 length:510 start_codon:yes stop_codon:yes gene_type:complete
VSVYRKAATDPAFLALMAGAAGTGAAVTGSGLLDLVRGETHGFNSGEIPLNFLIQYLAGLPAGVVATAAMAGDPVISEAVEKGITKVALKADPTIDIPDRVQGTPELDKIVAQNLEQAVEKGTKPLSREQIARNRLRRTGAGYLAAAGLGSVPAILAMKDQPAESLPVG